MMNNQVDLLDDPEPAAGGGAPRRGHDEEELCRVG